MSITCRIRISMDLGAKRAGAVRDALVPDNVNFPPGLAMSMSIQNDTMTILVEGDHIENAMGTIDEVLAHAQVALDAVG